MVKQKQRFGCVYRITNLIRNKAYIGKTIDFERRMREHKRSKGNLYIGNSIRKHGWHNFKVEILIDDVPEEDLGNLETCYIDVEDTMVPNGYNLTLGGEGLSGWKASKESCEKYRQAAIRRQTNRDQFGCVSFHKTRNKYEAYGPSPSCKYIGQYFTKAKAEEALNHFLKMGERMDSDRTYRKRGTGSIRKTKNGKRYRAMYMKNKVLFTKTFDTIEECEKWLENSLNHFNATGKIMESDRTRRRMGTGSIFKNGKRYIAAYTKNKKRSSKTFDTVEQCEEWLKIEAKQALNIAE